MQEDTHLAFVSVIFGACGVHLSGVSVVCPAPRPEGSCKIQCESNRICPGLAVVPRGRYGAWGAAREPDLALMDRASTAWKPLLLRLNQLHPCDSSGATTLMIDFRALLVLYLLLLCTAAFFIGSISKIDR